MKKYILVILTILMVLAYGCAQNVAEDTSTQTEDVTVDTNVPMQETNEAVEEDIEQMLNTGDNNAQGTYIINIKGFTFNPETVTVDAGTVVTWINKDDAKHTATSDENMFDSPLLSNGDKFSYTFDNPGTFTYYCKPHPYMVGTIIVE
jgi:plastocyanin